MNLDVLKDILDNELETVCFCFKVVDKRIHERIMIDRNSDISKTLLNKEIYNKICECYNEDYLLNFMFNGYRDFNLIKKSGRIKIDAKKYPLFKVSEEFTLIEFLSKYVFEKNDYICLATIDSYLYIFVLRKYNLFSDIFFIKYNNNYLIKNGVVSLTKKFKPFYKCKVDDCNNYETRKNKFLCCGQCKKVKYCSRNCQIEDWTNHKLTCGKQIIRTS